MVRSPFVVLVVLSLIFLTAAAHAQTQPPRRGRAAKFTSTQAPVVPQQTLDRLMARERELAAAEQRHAVAVIDEALAEDFHELATDGRLYAKSDIMPMLKDVVIEDFTQSDFQAFPIDAECVILTYVSTVKGNYKGHVFPSKVAASSVWAHRSGSWRVVFHQATPVAAQEE